MSTVVSSRRNSIISVNSGSRNESSIIIKKGGDTTLQGLTNVNSSNLQDGYTIFYDSETNTWVTSPITLLDGGTY